MHGQSDASRMRRRKGKEGGDGKLDRKFAIECGVERLRCYVAAKVSPGPCCYKARDSRIIYLVSFVIEHKSHEMHWYGGGLER